MSVKVIYETEKITQVRKHLKDMNREELDFVEYLLDQEKERRKNDVYTQFLLEIQHFKEKH